MNYLKSIKNIKTAKDLDLSERYWDNIQRDAIQLVEIIASCMYDAEMDRGKWSLWSAIKDILESLEAQR